MSVVEAPATEPAEPSAPVAPAPRAPRRWPWHLLVAALALALSGWVTHGLWLDPAGNVLASNVGDQAFFEWLLGYGVYTVGHGADPFFTDLLNAPLGVNLAVNTSITVYTVAFSPVTMLAGPQVSFVLILTLNLACAAFAWYLFLLRYLVRHPGAAALAGMFAGFAPGFISHANGHLNWSAGWVAPVLLWWVLKLREPGRWLRNGLVLGLLVTVGFSIAAEGLFFTALASGLFLATWSLTRGTFAEARAALPTVAAALSVTAVVAGVLLAYPIYMHFAGPQSFKGTGFNQRFYAEDIAAYIGYPARSLGGWLGLDTNLASNPTEETSFFGAPLLVLVVAALAMLWRRATPGRRATLRALAVTGAAFAVLSLGPRLRIFKDESDIPLPYAVLGRAPLFDSALPARFALVVAGVFAILLALAADRLLTAPPRGRARAAWIAGFAFALVPLIPIPLLYTQRTAEPKFIADGIWRDYVPEGGVLTTLPLPSNLAADGQRWQAYTMARGGRQFRIPRGYFLGPGGPDGTGRIGAVPRRTTWLLDSVARSGVVHRPITVLDRRQARIDLAAWDVDLVILPQQTTGPHGMLHRDAIMAAATQLLGPPERVADVDLWRITPGVDPRDTVGG